MMPVVILDAATVRYCAEIARQSGDAIKPIRAHYGVARGTLHAFADELLAMLPKAETAPSPQPRSVPAGSTDTGVARADMSRRLVSSSVPARES